MNAAVCTPILAATFLFGAAHAKPSHAQLGPEQDQSATTVTRAVPVPWEVGERLDYDVSLGPIGGSGYMEVRGTEVIRGVPTYHTVFHVKGGIPFFRVNTVFESWMGMHDLSSYRFKQDQDEGPNERQRHYEIYPDRRVFREMVKGEGEEQQSVANPLDDGSFLYFLRTVPLEVGKTYVFERYFRPDRNPVTIKVLRREQVKVPAGTYQAVVIQPMIKTKGIFSENGRAEVWLSDDDDRIMLQMKSRLSIGTLTLRLKQHREGGAPARSSN